MLKVKAFVMKYCFGKSITSADLKTEDDIYRDKILSKTLLINRKFVPTNDVSKYSILEIFNLIIYNGYYNFAVEYLKRKNAQNQRFNDFCLTHYARLSYIFYIFHEVNQYLMQLYPYVFYVSKFKQNPEFEHLCIKYKEYKKKYEKNMNMLNDLYLIKYELVDFEHINKIEELYRAGKELLNDTFNLMCEFRKTDYTPTFLEFEVKYNMSQMKDLFNLHFLGFIHVIEAVFKE